MQSSKTGDLQDKKRLIRKEWGVSPLILSFSSKLDCDMKTLKNLNQSLYPTRNLVTKGLQITNKSLKHISIV